MPNWTAPHNRKIEALKEFLLGYGTILNDAFAAWLYIGSDHQMCMVHQIRISKRCLMYQNPQNDVPEFLNKMIHLLQQYIRGVKIKDLHAKRVVTNCLTA